MLTEFRVAQLPSLKLRCIMLQEPGSFFQCWCPVSSCPEAASFTKICPNWSSAYDYVQNHLTESPYHSDSLTEDELYAYLQSNEWSEERDWKSEWGDRDEWFQKQLNAELGQEEPKEEDEAERILASDEEHDGDDEPDDGEQRQDGPYGKGGDKKGKAANSKWTKHWNNKWDNRQWNNNK